MSLLQEGAGAEAQAEADKPRQRFFLAATRPATWFEVRVHVCAVHAGDLAATSLYNTEATRSQACNLIKLKLLPFHLPRDCRSNQLVSSCSLWLG